MISYQICLNFPQFLQSKTSNRMIKNLNIVERNFLQKILQEEVAITKQKNHQKQNHLLKVLPLYEHCQQNFAKSLTQFYGFQRANKHKQKAIMISNLRHELQGLKNMMKNCYQKQCFNSMKLLQQRCEQMRGLKAKIKQQELKQKHLSEKIQINSDSQNEIMNSVAKESLSSQLEIKQIKQLQQLKTQLLEKLQLDRQSLKFSKKQLSQNYTLPKLTLLKQNQVISRDLNTLQDEKNYRKKLSQDFAREILQLNVFRQQRKQQIQHYQKQLEQILINFQQTSAKLFENQNKIKESNFSLSRQIQRSIDIKNKLLLKKSETIKIKLLNQLLSQDFKQISKLSSQLKLALANKLVKDR